MSGARRHRTGTRGALGFTLIEMLAVITIIMLVIALALPNFVAMMKGRKWTAAVANIQMMVWRGRALATNVRKDISVEFDIQGDNGTWMWLESEDQILERIPDLDELQHNIGGGYYSVYWILQLWRAAGGTYEWGYYECKCKKCGHEWNQYSRPSACPNPAGCSAASWEISWQCYFYDFQMPDDPDDRNPEVHNYGDNARQTEIVKLGHGMTIDPDVSANFFNWDSETAVEKYGWDAYKDIRMGPNGALVQTQDCILCIKDIHSEDYQRVSVVRCTGRLVKDR